MRDLVKCRFPTGWMGEWYPLRIYSGNVRPPAGANEFAAGKSQSPPARTRRPGGVQRPTHLRVRYRDYRIRFLICIMRGNNHTKSAFADWRPW
jgi:hypothetical protein